MKIVLADTNKEIVVAWKNFAPNDIDIHHSSFETLATEAIVSPANSFMIMDGGVDFYIRKILKKGIEDKLRDEAVTRFGMPFLPIGCAVSCETGVERFPMLISSPTMTVPQLINDTPYAFVSTIAALNEANRINATSVLFMGMGGLTGGYHPDICAKQMIDAITYYRSGDWTDTSAWNGVKAMYNRLLLTK